jgi:hypothetical protein
MSYFNPFFVVAAHKPGLPMILYGASKFSPQIFINSLVRVWKKYAGRIWWGEKG